MPQPYDYRVKATNLLSAGLEGFGMAQDQRIKQMAIEQQRMAMEQQQAEAEEKARKQAEMQAAMAEFAQKPDKTRQDYLNFFEANPQYAAMYKQSFEALEPKWQQQNLNQVARVYNAFKSGNEEVTNSEIDQQIEAFRNAGREDQAKSLEQMKTLIAENPEAADTSIRSYLMANGGEKLIKGAEGEAGRTQKSEILKDGSTIQVLNNGDVVVKNSQGQIVTGNEATKVIMRGRDYGVKLAKDINYNREEGKWQGAKGIKAEVEGDVAGKKAQETGKEKRVQSLIERGSLAAESTAGLKRGIKLLGSLKTGGVNAVALRAKQLFGLESADEGELSNQLSKAVLSQLRETFGAAFTEREGARLERIEASFTKSQDANRRLLEQALVIAERTAQRAMKAAEARGDFETVEDIKDLLEFSLDPEDIKTTPEKKSGEETTADLFNQLQNIMRP
ncbi:MAG: hypothetical protein KJP07_23270 [Desulfatitalea sp.]|nr:hypothetical protein [Desulfatitalea sp.]